MAPASGNSCSLRTGLRCSDLPTAVGWLARASRTAACLTAALLLGSCGDTAAPEQTIEVRLISDLTGPNKTVGASFHAGRVDRLEEINRTGGIRGLTVSYQAVDTGGDSSKAVQSYLSWKNTSAWPAIRTIFGHDTDSTAALVERVTGAHMPFLSQSLSGTLASPLERVGSVKLEDGSALELANPGAPYSFFVAVDHSSAVRGALDFVAGKGARAIAFCYCAGSRDCTEPVAVGKAYARGRLSMQVLDDLIIASGATQADVDVLVTDYLTRHPSVEWMWLGQAHDTAVRVIKAAADHQVKLLANIYAMGESLDADSGHTARGKVFGVVGATPYGSLTNAPGMLDLVTVHDRSRPSAEYANGYYVLGYATVVAWEIAVERLRAAGKEISRENIKASLESLRNANTGGLLPPLSFAAEDHRPTTSVRIYSFDKAGLLRFEADKEVDRRPEWLGW